MVGEDFLHEEPQIEAMSQEEWNGKVIRDYYPNKTADREKDLHAVEGSTKGRACPFLKINHDRWRGSPTKIGKLLCGLFEEAVRGGRGLRPLVSRWFFLRRLFGFAFFCVLISHEKSLPQVGESSQAKIARLGRRPLQNQRNARL
jgi:hypothetical protein